jgi:prepilin-type N-terminal cleavage/methylation domain-containing protein/prepilin-type processing-associated H-X9-DG protein
MTHLYKHQTVCRCRRGGFTLVELLVVIGIIALLISILLPALSKARKAANTVACSANLHSITLGMMMYVQQYHGAIPGNGWTSGAFLEPPPSGTSSFSDKNCPSISQMWDWTAPIARVMGVKFDEGPTLVNRTARFSLLNLYPPFQCVENDVPEGPYSASPVTITTKMLSYATSIYFQMQYSTSNTDYTRYQNYVNTGNYSPYINQVGDTSRKIWMSDAARYTNGPTSTPDYNLTYNATNLSQAYSDPGPWDAYSESFLPGAPIVYSMRHGSRQVNAQPQTYRFNVAFFDGHVESMDGLAAMNPYLWVPKGTMIPSSECNATANSVYLKGVAQVYAP